MVRRNSCYVIRRENNILEVDFRREPSDLRRDSRALAGYENCRRAVANQIGRSVN